MCLPIKVHRPADVLAEGVHAGLEWTVTNNSNGYRCGYVRVPKGHPWHGKTDSDLWEMEAHINVHGGITFAEPDEHCGKGEDDAWWLGFDCAHSMDGQDLTLPHEHAFPALLRIGEVRTQEYVESECRKLCEQAAAAATK